MILMKKNNRLHVIKEAAMKAKKALLFIFVITLLYICSCGETTIDQGDTFDAVAVEQPEPQRMAYHLSGASRVGDDIYFVGGVSFNKAQIFATEYGAENFEPFIPCFDAVCNHWDRTKCCIATGAFLKYTDKIMALLHEGEISLVLFGDNDISFSKPYSNVKTNLVCDDIVYMEYPTEDSEVMGFLEALSSAPNRSNLLIYGDYFYYTEIKNGTRTQYRIPLTGGESKRVFEEDNIIIKTIINDRFYGIRYDIDPANPEEIIRDRDRIHYFRSDMNYENIEPLPEMLDFFSLLDEDNIRMNTNAILDADKDYIYVLYQMKVWAIPDSDIYAEPVLLSDLSEKIPSDLPRLTWDRMWYSDGVLYIILNTGHYGRSLLDRQGNSGASTQWYEKSELYSFDVRCGECKTIDISDQSYLISWIRYADDKYVYAEGSYAHNDGRGIQGVTMRLTLDTMRYEVILPDDFLEYSAETTAN